jgi:hypothetical protein
MWPVKDPHLIKQKDRNPAACPFFNFGTQLNEKALNIAPLDIAARRPRKDQFNNPLVPPFHTFIVPFSGTEHTVSTWSSENGFVSFKVKRNRIEDAYGDKAQFFQEAMSQWCDSVRHSPASVTALRQ